ncbi:MAG: hypothetical protein OEZ03_07475 [Alphaproteobacteria bacterium]|nr:hypothetical protein [Alphaproteobacteria bacterium]
MSEQARLAMSLIESLGREGAIHACRANGWDGVLNYLLGPSAGQLGAAAARTGQNEI